MAMCAISHQARAEVNVADPGTFVVDRAGIVDDRTERELEGWLRELEQKTTAQVKLLTVPTIDGEDMFSFTHRHAERWKLGRKGKDNGVLVAVAMKEREFRIHTGYGIEEIIPDSWAGSLHRRVIKPSFQKGRYSEGLKEAIVAIANKVADASNVQLTGIPQYRHAPARVPRGAGCGIGIIPFIIIILLLTRRRRYHRRWGGGLGEAIFWGSVLSNLGRGGRRGGWSGGFGGGFGGGGFGGSFGGGGRFGGGGGGGRW